MAEDTPNTDTAIVTSKGREISPVEKAAILMMTLGEDTSAEVLKHMGPREVQKIGHMMSQLADVTKPEVEMVLNEFVEGISNHTSLGVGNESFIKNMMVNALGEDKAGSLMDRILTGANTAGLDTLKWMDPKQVADLIRYEHPQIQAIVLAYLDPDQSSEIVKQFDEKVRLDLVIRIASLEAVQPQAMHELNSILEKQFAKQAGNSTTSMGGVKCAANIVNFLESSVEEALMSSINEVDEELAVQIQDLMFTFDNLKELDDKGIQALLREISSESLILALKGSDDVMKQKILDNMSKRAAELMVDDLEAKGPVKVSDVEAAQKEIISIARRLADSGEIILGGKGAEEMI
jgi:flagellar motor switch protein FliG